MGKYPELESLSKEELIEIIVDEAKNWLAHDGLWFQAVERHFGLETAIKLDEEAWKDFTVIEANRIKKRLNLPENGGLDALEKALNFRMYRRINDQIIERVDENILVLKMINCRVQAARERKKMDFFPCKSVGIIEYSYFAKAIDSRIETEVIKCPPDDIKNSGFYCAWKFVLNK
ncbi:conserved hypothetical protein [Deferribacter desulfuricans SSM1]|uniref:L-2-amino-thiazoline-4-carboxylic acid hydrolase n=1 Tax=Deferribacter desulfuricans (strain DSM 14783 / JCM 11476 / NBRC 101012 / SSM1) TaxID=639282 RepID=D3P8W7_DEFDS|nr:DUF6125 family protein [Deferribacter desulfuricans]BAI81157.1 conserved hypothetical protein [Deferribacter desulfuricans SSM1]